MKVKAYKVSIKPIGRNLNSGFVDAWTKLRWMGNCRRVRTEGPAVVLLRALEKRTRNLILGSSSKGSYRRNLLFCWYASDADITLCLLYTHWEILKIAALLMHMFCRSTGMDPVSVGRELWSNLWMCRYVQTWLFCSGLCRFVPGAEYDVPQSCSRNCRFGKVQIRHFCVCLGRA